MILGGLFLKKMNAMFHIIILYELSDQYLCLCDMATVDRYPLDVQYCGVCGMPPEVDVTGELYEPRSIKLLPVVLRFQWRNSEMP